MTNPIANSIGPITDLFATWQRTDGTEQVIVLPKPSDFGYNANFKLLDLFERSKLGVNVKIGSVDDESTPEVELTWTVKTLTLLAMQYGYAFGTPGQTPIAAVTNRFPITQALYEPSEEGYEGFGVVKNAISIGGYEDPNEPGVNVPLTQQPFDSFSASSPNTFAVGTDFALKLSTNLIRPLSNALVASVSVPNLVGSGLKLLDEKFTDFAFTYNQILADRTIVQTSWPSVSLKRDSTTVDAKTETKITYSINDTTGGCSVPDVIYLGKAQSRRC